jgi:hypothetical protein
MISQFRQGLARRLRIRWSVSKDIERLVTTKSDPRRHLQLPSMAYDSFSDVSFDNGIIDSPSHLSVMTPAHAFAAPISKSTGRSARIVVKHHL